ncbi:MAG: hypothetical protein KF684_12105 [Phycisphaeraceae bacterium]|nr:hypothetical protein [Phycisphaeraceae bacterium]
MTSRAFPRRRRAGLCAAAIACVAGAASAQEFRTFTGESNNLANPSWGAAHQLLLRSQAGSFYGPPTFTFEMGGQGRENARVISNILFSQPSMVFDSRGLTDMVWQWGQFLDHDLDLTHATKAEPIHIATPIGDPWFDPNSLGTGLITAARSVSVHTPAMLVREHPNVLTAYIDASQLYGSDDAKASWLRAYAGGRLKVSSHATGDLMPFGDGVVENDSGPFGADPTTMFVAGDVRSNEQSGLAAMHTLWVREHNRVADLLAAANPAWSDEEVFQRARSVVAALMQVITYNEFIPALLGENALPAYAGYDDAVNAGILTEFSAAAFRVGHTMLSSEILRPGENQQTIPEGNLLLRDMFFDPSIILDEGGIDPILRGLATGNMQRVDTKVIDDVRNFLFGAPGAGGRDLVTVNIQRGRDHGLPDFNSARVAFGLAPKNSFAQISSDPEVQLALEAAYGDTTDMDLWPLLMAEDHFPGASVGETLRAILLDQFRRARDGDRFFYLNPAEPSDLVDTLSALGMTLADLDQTTLGQVIRRNTGIVWLHDYVFRLRLPGDATGNGVVNFEDLSAVLTGFGGTGVGSVGDTNGDGRVDFLDLNNVLSSFGASY